MTSNPATSSASGISRRQMIGGAAATAVLLSVSRTRSVASATSGPDETWEFTDDRGVTVSLARRPERVVAYVGTAAVLWDFGVRPIGVFGPQRQPDGTPEPAAGNVDLDAVESVGDTWDAINLEALAELQPDLVVTGGISDDDLWIITEDQIANIEELAPIVAVQAYDKPAREIIAGYERLALALGIDGDDPMLATARQELDTATAALAAAVAAQPGLTAIFTYADAEGLWIAKPAAFPDILEFQTAGLDVVEPTGGDQYYEMLAWELADQYPADLLLHDERSFSLQPDVLEADYPTWRTLPAVRAGQVGHWSAETVLSYQGFTAAVVRLTESVTTADPDVM